MADIPELPTVNVIGRQYDALQAQQLQSQIDYYRNISDFLWQSMAVQPDYVQVWQPPIDLTTIDLSVAYPDLPSLSRSPEPDLEEIVVTGRQVPFEDLYGDELLEIGTDSALLEFRRRGYPMPNPGGIDYDAPPPNLLFDPVQTVPQYYNYQGYEIEEQPRQRPRPKDPFESLKRGDPPKRTRVPALEFFGRLLSPLFTGIAALLFPQPMGPRRWDEYIVPDLPELQPQLEPKPVARPLPISDLPELPEYVVTAPNYPRSDPLERYVLPVGDMPGVFSNPYEFSPFPREMPTPGPGDQTVSDPDWSTFEPFGDPFSVPTIDPDTPVSPQPGIPPEFGPSDIPYDPFNLQPGRPIEPSIPIPYTPITYPLPEVPFDVLAPVIVSAPIDPLQFALPPGETAKDPCDCGNNQKKKKKKKKPEDRKICYRGTYIERKRGLTKKRLEEVPCETRSRTTKPVLGTSLANELFGLP